MGNKDDRSYSSDSPNEDPYITYPMQENIPATWQNTLDLDTSKIALTYQSDEEFLEGYIGAMKDGVYKSSYVLIYEQAKKYRRLSYSDPKFVEEKTAIEANHSGLLNWYNKREEQYKVSVAGKRTTWSPGMTFPVIWAIMVDLNLRRYVTTYPQSEKLLRLLNAYVYKVMQLRSIPGAISPEATLALNNAQNLLNRYNALPNKNDPALYSPLLNEAQEKYNSLMRESGNHPDTYLAGSLEVTEKALALLDVILKEKHGNDSDNPDYHPTDEKALLYEHFPAFENALVKYFYFNNIPESLKNPLEAIKQFKMYSLDNTGIMVSTLVNLLLVGVKGSLISTGCSYAYKIYYKNTGTGPLADLSSKYLLGQGASDSRFMDSIRTGKAIFSDVDYTAYLTGQAVLAGPMSIVGTLAGFGASKLLDTSWEAIKNIPGLGWLIGSLGEDVHEVFNDVSTDKFVSGFL